MRGAPPLLSRGQMLRTLPSHVLFAIISGALTGFLLYLLSLVQLPGRWNLVMLFPLAGIYVNGATLPVAIPGRHWSFSFLCSMSMLLLLVAGMILAAKINFPHSYMPGAAAPLTKVNALTVAGMVTGACLGLFYGVLAGQKGAMVVGLAMGVATGYVLGLLSTGIVSGAAGSFDAWIYDGPLHFAWQGALAFGALHLGSGLGALLGAVRN